MRWLVVIAVLAGCGAPTPPPVVTKTIVSSPGPLIASHATLACTDCHYDNASPYVDPVSCVRCHPALVARIDANQGLHAQRDVRSQACTECHRDHRGAHFDARWAFFGGRDRFDHAATGYKLEKGHRVDCVKCHTAANAPSPSYTGLSFACGSCHPQPHANMPYAKFACETCHLTAETWTTLSFDHAEKTLFDLGNSHRQLACASCHATSAKPPRGCATCHASRDPHAGRFQKFGTPPACEKCHAPSMAFTPGQPPPAWRANVFNHGRWTGWALDSKHASISCRACHGAPGTTTFVPVGAGKDCLGCHEHRNVHARKYGNDRCLYCHMAPGSTWVTP